VVAINIDDKCDMVKRADLSAIGDSTAILGDLLHLVAQHRAGQNHPYEGVNHG
jgi:electron transfer flavoprotein alpha subunit